MPPAVKGLNFLLQIYHMKSTKCHKLCFKNKTNIDGIENKLYVISYLQPFQSTVIGHLGVRLNLVQNLVVKDKRHVNDLAQILHRNIMGIIVKEILHKQIPAIQYHVQVKSL